MTAMIANPIQHAARLTKANKMTAMIANPIQHAARLTKANKMAALLHRGKISADLAILQTPQEWARIASLAGCHWDPKRTHEETISIILDTLEQFGGRL